MRVTEQTFITSKGIQQILTLLGYEFSIVPANEPSKYFMRVWYIGDYKNPVFKRELDAGISKHSKMAETHNSLVLSMLENKRALRIGFHTMRKEKIITIEQLENLDIQVVDTISVTLLGDHDDNTMISGPIDPQELLDALQSLVDCTIGLCNRETEDRWPIELIRAKQIADRYKS